MKLLVPFDFSEEAVHALKLAKELADALHSEVKILHALNYPKFPYNNTVEGKEFGSALTKKAKEAIDYTLRELHIDNNNIKVEISNNKVASSIITSTYDNELQYTVIGRKEHVIPKKVGSTTRDILRYAKGSIISVQKDASLNNIKNILMITDFSNTPIKAIGKIKTIQELSGAQITCLYVNTKQDWATTEDIQKRKQDFCKTHSLTNTTLEIVNDNSLEEGIAYITRAKTFDFIGLTIKLFEDNADIINTHLSIERMLHNINIPLMSYAYKPAIFN